MGSVAIMTAKKEMLGPFTLARDTVMNCILMEILFRCTGEAHLSF